jgi:hypothetical protein
VSYSCSTGGSTDQFTLRLSGSVTDLGTTCPASDSDTATLTGTPDPYLLVEDGDSVPYCPDSTSVIVNFNVTSSLLPLNWASPPPQVIEDGVTCAAVASTVANPNPMALLTVGGNSKSHCCLWDRCVPASGHVGLLCASGLRAASDTIAKVTPEDCFNKHTAQH